jgi:radical SAM protein with 4Fe4S-binding SPASM domain
LSENEPICEDDVVVDGDALALLGHVQQWAYRNLVPLSASIELTLRCNIRCLHCYNFDRDEPRAKCGATGAREAPAKPELSTDEILRVMEELRASGCLFLQLTGGEALSHPDLFVFLDHARKLNLSVQLLTNGTMLRPGVAARLASYENLLGVSVSVYGATAEVHDGITQMPGSFRRTWDGIGRLGHLGVTVRVKFILMKQNAHEAAAMRAEADRRGLPYLVDVNITSRHDGTRGSLATRMDRAQIEALYRGPLADLAHRGPRKPTEESFPCNCARGNVGITATGDVVPCVSVPWAAGNVREQPFAEIWRSSPVFERIRGLKIADYEHCAPCAHQSYCRRSRGAAMTASGSYTGIDPFVCAQAEIAHEIADERAAAAASASATADAPRVRARLAVVR